MDQSPSQASSSAGCAASSSAPEGADIELRSGCGGVAGCIGASMRCRFLHGTCPFRMDIACGHPSTSLQWGGSKALVSMDHQISPETFTVVSLTEKPEHDLEGVAGSGSAPCCAGRTGAT